MQEVGDEREGKRARKGEIGREREREREREKEVTYLIECKRGQPVSHRTGQDLVSFVGSSEMYQFPHHPFGIMSLYHLGTLSSRPFVLWHSS
jgi:hypothetical protein